MGKNFGFAVTNFKRNFGKAVDISNCHNQVHMSNKKDKDRESETRKHIHRKGNYVRFNTNTNCYIYKCYVCNEEYEIPK